jgi:hypothetical protein
VSQADFFCGKLNGITFPYSSGGIHFVAFFLKLLGMKNSMIFAINHPTCKNKTGAKKFSFSQISTDLRQQCEPPFITFSRNQSHQQTRDGPSPVSIPMAENHHHW